MLHAFALELLYSFGELIFCLTTHAAHHNNLLNADLLPVGVWTKKETFAPKAKHKQLSEVLGRFLERKKRKKRGPDARGLAFADGDAFISAESAFMRDFM